MLSWHVVSLVNKQSKVDRDLIKFPAGVQEARNQVQQPPIFFFIKAMIEANKLYSSRVYIGKWKKKGCLLNVRETKEVFSSIQSLSVHITWDMPLHHVVIKPDKLVKYGSIGSRHLMDLLFFSFSTLSRHLQLKVFSFSFDFSPGSHELKSQKFFFFYQSRGHAITVLLSYHFTSCSLKCQLGNVLLRLLLMKFFKRHIKSVIINSPTIHSIISIYSYNFIKSVWSSVPLFDLNKITFSLLFPYVC